MALGSQHGENEVSESEADCADLELRGSAVRVAS